MADDNKHQDNDKSAKKIGEFRLQPRTWLVWVIIIGGIVLLVTMKDRLEVPRASLSQYEFFQKVDSNLVASASINYGAPVGPNRNCWQLLSDQSGREQSNQGRGQGGRSAISYQGAVDRSPGE